MRALLVVVVPVAAAAWVACIGSVASAPADSACASAAGTCVAASFACASPAAIAVQDCEPATDAPSTTALQCCLGIVEAGLGDGASE